MQRAAAAAAWRAWLLVVQLCLLRQWLAWLVACAAAGAPMAGVPDAALCAAAPACDACDAQLPNPFGQRWAGVEGRSVERLRVAVRGVHAPAGPGVAYVWARAHCLMVLPGLY